MGREELLKATKEYPFSRTSEHSVREDGGGTIGEVDKEDGEIGRSIAGGVERRGSEGGVGSVVVVGATT